MPKFEVYVRWCKKCGKLYKTYCKYGRVCRNCVGNSLNAKWIINNIYPENDFIDEKSTPL